MHREVKINIPMFIGIILLITVATTVLVYTVNVTREYIRRDNERMDEWFDQLEGEVDNRVVMENEVSSNQKLDKKICKLLQNYKNVI